MRSVKRRACFCVAGAAMRYKDRCGFLGIFDIVHGIFCRIQPGMMPSHTMGGDGGGWSESDVETDTQPVQADASTNADVECVPL